MTDEVQQIKDKIDIGDLIGEYVQLKPAGVNKKALCPFHHEKTPSFMVNQERQSWKCFGCNKGGDIFSFLQEIEGMDFPEALRYLADRAGVRLTERRSEVNTSQKNRIKEINIETARFFHKFLLQIDSARLAREYLNNRGLKQETIETWQIGYIPEQWDLLTKYLLKKGYAIDDLVASGLTIKRENADKEAGRGFYDRFRGRIMFPIANEHNEVVGFTGRILVEKENTGGKYVNTPQTLVYDKSRVIFGLYNAKQAIKAQDLVVMVEGQMDVIACHQAGINNVVATSGTALTEMQIKLLQRYSHNISMAFDADEAGQKAAKRGIDLSLAAGMNVKVIVIPPGAGKDPDECVKKDPGQWKRAVSDAQDIMVWYFNRAFQNKNLNNPKHKQAVVDQLLPEISLIPKAVERDHWLHELAGRIKVDNEVLREDLKRFKAQPKQSFSESKPSELILEKTRLEKLEEMIFALAFRFPSLIPNLYSEKSKKMLSTCALSELYYALEKEYNDNSIGKDKILLAFSGTKFQKTVDNLLMLGEVEFFDITADGASKEIEKLIEMMAKERLAKQRNGLQLEIMQAEKQGDKEKEIKLVKDFQDLSF